MKSTRMYLFVIVFLTVLYGCDHPVMCSASACWRVVPDPIQGYKVDADLAMIWLVVNTQDGRSCLPCDVTIRNIVAPETCKVTVHPLGWIKGRPLMWVYLMGATEPHESISFDIYQGIEKKQTVTISVTRVPEVIVIVDGKHLPSVQQ